MYQYQSLNDTIAAIATATGAGGIGIVRISGADALSVAEKIFVAKSTTPTAQLKSHAVHYGWIVSSENSSAACVHEGVPQEAIDEVLLTIMRAPKSYTKEDVVEISCHGGSVSLRAILDLTLRNGARLAEPGEFTKRAFLNGRIDLTQAEAVLDIIQSKTDAFLKVSTNQLKGELSVELEQIREMLMACYVEMEAIVNFPEDDIDSEGRKKLVADLEAAKIRVQALLDSSDHGQILKEGIKIVLCGKPNVGKSSLLNVFLRAPRAIVSDIAGTTRDTIEETAQIKGIPFQLVDTAGILDPRDLIEEEAIKRSQMSIQGADLVLFVLDASEPFSEMDERLLHAIEGLNVFVLVNKIDLPQKLNLSEIEEKLTSVPFYQISATQKKGIDELQTAILENVWHARTVDTHGIMISNLRHIKALEETLQTLSHAQQTLNDNHSLEFVSEDVKLSVNLLDRITGRNIDDDLLDTIFSQFCIGK